MHILITLFLPPACFDTMVRHVMRSLAYLTRLCRAHQPFESLILTPSAELVSPLHDILRRRNNATMLRPMSLAMTIEPSQHTIGWVCAILPDFVAAKLHLDEEHDDRL